MKLTIATKTFMALCACLTASVAPAQALSVFFSADAPGSSSGSVEAALPISKLGSVPLPRGRFLIRGNYAELSMVPEWQFEHQKVLYGTVLDTHLAQSGARRVISGTVWFNQGDWLNYYDQPGAIETLTTNAGPLSGRINGVHDDHLAFTTVSGVAMDIPLASIIAIRSPRAFNFSIPIGPLVPGPDGEPPTAEANTVALSATGPGFHLASLAATVRRESDDGDVPTRKLVLVATALSAIELAQLAPFMAIPIYSPHLSHLMLRREFYSLTQGAASPRASFTNALLPP